MNARALIAALAGGALLSLTGCTTSPVTAPSTPALTFRQPVVDVGQDPFVVRWRNRYLLVQARSDDEIWVLVSPVDDLTGIGARGTAVRIWTAPDHGGACTDVWAPELHRVGSRWIVYYSATTCDGSNDAHRMFAIESAGSDPLSGYRDAGEVAGPADTWSIDGTRFIWHGTAYFVWSGWPDRDGSRQNLYIARMSSTTRLETARVVLSTPSEPWERRGAPINEGPQALRHAGRLFIVYSASGSWTDSYADGLLALTGADPLDPDAWTKSPHPVFQSTGEVFGPGHGSFVESPDGRESWMVYHSAIAEGSGWDRQIDMQRFSWRQDGTPDFGRPVDPSSPRAVPSGQRAAGP